MNKQRQLSVRQSQVLRRMADGQAFGRWYNEKRDTSDYTLGGETFVGIGRTIRALEKYGLIEMCIPGGFRLTDAAATVVVPAAATPTDENGDES